MGHARQPNGGNAGCAGLRTRLPVREEVGRACGEPGRGGGRAVSGLGRFPGLGSDFFSLFYLLFFFKLHSNYFEFKRNLNSNSYALNQIKSMHQHVCTNMSNLENFTYL